LSSTLVDSFVSANGLRLHYRRWSPAEPRPGLPPILLLHGLASAAPIWDFVAPLLAAQGYEVTALDQRGHGESDKPETGYDFATILADDSAAMQALDIERPVIAGHSWGAMVALQYAATYPERVRALVSVDGATFQLSQRPGWSREQARKELAPPRFAGTPRATFLSYFRSGPLGKQWTPELEDSVLHIVQLREDDTVAPRLAFENHMQIIDAMWGQPTLDLYAQVRRPVTLIVARQQAQDENQEARLRMQQQNLARLQDRYPNIAVVLMPDTIHDIPLQRPRELVEEIIRHIASQG
jgi:pimeloyl-ACP methyl ester carboxylesterase